MKPLPFEREHARFARGFWIGLILVALAPLLGGCTPMNRDRMLLTFSTSMRGIIAESDDPQETAREMMIVAERVKHEASQPITVGDLRHIVTQQVVNRIDHKRTRIRVMLGAGLLFDYAEIWLGFDPTVIPADRLENLRLFINDCADRAIWVAKPIAEME